MSESPLHRIELKCVGQSFKVNESQIHLFQNLSLSVEQGQSYAITGQSGTGKSSLLMLMAGLENPASGQGHYVKNNQVASLNTLREDAGFIFQQFHLLPELSALHNVALPLKLRGQKDAEDKATEWLERVGLSQRLHHTPQQLSGGEQQRVAIARALVFKPRFIFADEPTGNLDTKSADEVANILFSCCQQHGAGLVIVTHSLRLAKRAQHVFSLSDGVCQQDKQVAWEC